MPFRLFFPLVFALTLLWTVPSGAQGAEDFYKAGITAFEAGKLDEARAQFGKALAVNPNNPWVLYNLGLTEHRAGKAGLAIGLWRKALSAAPGFPPAKSALAWAVGRLERSEIPHEILFWETFRRNFLAPVPLTEYIALSALLLLLAGLLLLRYFGARRRALLDEKPLPPFPTVATFFSALFAVSTLAALAKVYDLSVQRATVVPPKVEVHATPETSSAVLFDLFEGLEVVVRQSSNDWVQVTYPGGPTGWIKKDALIIAAE